MISPASTYDSGDDTYFKQLQSPVHSGTFEFPDTMLDAGNRLPGSADIPPGDHSTRQLKTSESWRSVDRSTRNLPPTTLQGACYLALGLWQANNLCFGYFESIRAQ